MTKTSIIIQLCRLLDGERKTHATWCEYITGLHQWCDCGYSDNRINIDYLENQLNDNSK